MKVVSLLPSATEMVAALGLADLLVGVSHKCDWPPEVAELPRVTRSVLTTESTAAERSATIRRYREAGLPTHHLDEALMRELSPDVILTQDVCEVCAVPAEQAQAVASVSLQEAKVVTLQARRLEHILRNLESLGEELGVPDRGRRLATHIRQRLDRVAQAVADRPRPRVFAMEWFDPVKCTGAWLPDLIEAAGGNSLLTVPGDNVREIAWAEVLEAQPETLLIMPCGWSLGKTAIEARTLNQRPGWRELPAVQAGRVYLVDGRICSKHGPRVADAVELLAHLLHPGTLPGAADERLALSWEQAYGETP